MNRVVLATGGALGIGLATAKLLVASGLDHPGDVAEAPDGTMYEGAQGAPPCYPMIGAP